MNMISSDNLGEVHAALCVVPIKFSRKRSLLAQERVTVRISLV
ncbi:hypothetical protein [Calothrix sp. PCC 6303]|nr:hypothetical protein [Calothrix sp. PCC 6303]